MSQTCLFMGLKVIKENSIISNYGNTHTLQAVSAPEVSQCHRNDKANNSLVVLKAFPMFQTGGKF